MKVKNIKIEWVGASKVLPLCGMASEGKILTVPEDIGMSYINQGFAIAYKAKSKKQSTKDKEV